MKIRNVQRVTPLAWAATLIFALTLLTNTASAQDKYENRGMLNSAAAGPRTSPWPPETPCDTNFVVDEGPGLDTYCSFRSEGPLIFDIIITRYVGPVGSDNYLDDLNALTTNGIISKTATLKMPAYDVDNLAIMSPPFDPERDRVTINGHEIGFLDGLNNLWSPNTLTVPIEYLKFPDKNDPNGVANTIRIDIDIDNVDINDELWCTAIDWAALSFQAARPVLLVHGCCLGSEDSWKFWKDELDKLQIINERIPVGPWSTIQHNSSMIAPRVAEMRSRYGVDKINIVSHSKGGLDSRNYIHSNNDIDKLIMVGTPNAGSGKADFGQGLLTLAPGVSDEIVVLLSAPGLWQLTTVYMTAYNLFVGENNHTKYITQAGSYDPDGWVKGSSLIWGEDDTWVAVTSVQALDYALNLTTHVSSGNDESAKHDGLIQSGTVYNDLKGFLVPTSVVPTPAERSMSSIALSEASASPLQRVKSAPGMIAPGDVNYHTISVDEASQVFFNCLWAGGDLDIVLIDPAGRRIDPAEADVDPNIEHSFEDPLGGIFIDGYVVAQPNMVGDWQLEITAVDVPATGLLYFVGAMIEGSGISLDVLPDKKYYRNSDPIALTANLQNSGSPVLGAAVTTKILLPDNSAEELTLFDDGTNGDITAGDGLYANSFVNTIQSGLYRMLILAEQTGAPRFTREVSLLASVAASRSEFDGAFGDAGIDTDGDGLFNTLDIGVGVSIESEGQYAVTGALLDIDGNTISSVSVESHFGVGIHTVQLSYDGILIASHHMNGPYTLGRLTLAEINADGPTIVDFLDPAFETQAYDYRFFQKPSIFFTGSTSDYGTDLNGNGQYDLLTVELEVDLLSSGYYQWSANLIDGSRTVIGLAAGSAQLDAGMNTISLSFEGAQIGANGVDGPFIVTSLLMFGGGNSVVTSDVATTSAYRYIEFEGAVLPFGSISGTISSAGTGMQGVAISLMQDGSEVDSEISDALGNFNFADLPFGDYVVDCQIPLGMAPDGESVVPVTVRGSHAVSFMLSNSASGKTIDIWAWKTQLKAIKDGKKLYNGLTLEKVNELGELIFSHFYGRSDGFALKILGVTYAEGPRALTLDDFYAALFSGDASIKAKAERAILANLLNIAAGYQGQLTTVTVDGATATQTITYFAGLYNAGGTANYNLVYINLQKMHQKQLIAAGVVPLGTPNILYKPGEDLLPIDYSLSQNYPNPFNPTTNISFSLPVASEYTLTIYNAVGQVVEEMQGHASAGVTTLPWNGSAHSSGVYLYRLQSGSFVDSKKMMLLK